jgi:hypothetical protein
MGSSLSPVVATFYMEHFKERELDLAHHKPLCWFRYVDETPSSSGHMDPTS